MSRAVTLMGMGASASGNLEIIGEAWGLNNGYDRFRGLKFDRFFELHSYEHAKNHKPNAQGHDHFTRLDMLNCPIYMQEQIPQIRQSRKYPLDDICCFFATNYFIGSPSYMLALALYEGVQHIRVYGFDHADEQHMQQRQSWTFWMSKAQTLGVTIDGTHNWLSEWDKDANGCMNDYRASAIPAMKQAVDEKRIVGRTVLVAPRIQPVENPASKPPTQVPVKEEK